MTRPAGTLCVICHRVVYVTDVDAEGRCVGCRPAIADVAPAPETPGEATRATTSLKRKQTQA